MPTIDRHRGLRVFFYSNERDEPPHVHVENADREAKVWLSPLVAAAKDACYGFRPDELADIVELVTANRDTYLERWTDFHEDREPTEPDTSDTPPDA